jgi:REP element-mobilizing transposase RayT
MHAYLIGIAKEYAIDVKAIGGTGDHVHALIAVPPRLSVATVVRTLKANSSKWMNESGHLFAWQQGYGVFSVSSSNVNVVCDYILRQKEHHRTRSFEEEFQEFLRKHGIESTSLTKLN